MKKLLTFAIAAIMIISVLVLPVSADIYVDNFDYDEIHDEKCNAHYSYYYTYMPFEMERLENVLGRDLPKNNRYVHHDGGSGKRYTAQWCSCRFIHDDYFTGRINNLVDEELDFEDYVELGLYKEKTSVFSVTTRTDESSKVPGVYYCLEKLDLFSKKEEFKAHNAGLSDPDYSSYDEDGREPHSQYIPRYTDEETDALFSGDKELVLQTLKCPFAFYYDGVVYSQYEIMQTLANYFGYYVGSNQGAFCVDPLYSLAPTTNSDFVALNEAFSEKLDELVYDGHLIEFLAEQYEYYKEHDVHYNAYVLEAYLTELTEEYPDVDVDFAPQTGTLTAALAIVALASGAYIVTRKRKI